MTSELFGIAFVAGAAVLTVRIFKSGFQPARSQLEIWADKAGFKLVSAAPRVLLRGPFFLANGMQKVFRIVAIDDQGVVRRGWACCGWFLASWKIGLEDKVVVEWDSQQ